MGLADRSLTSYAGLGAPPQRPAGGFSPQYLVLHDYGGTPKTSFNPYHALVMPDGSVRYRDQQNPYGAPAPHAFKLNPVSVGLSYGGQVGATPTPQAMDALRAERAKIAAQFPGIKTLSHGEAYQQTAGGPQQASRDGRGIDEASWRTRLDWSPYDIDNDPNPPEMGGAKPQPAAPATAVAGSTQRAQPMQPGLTAASPLPTQQPQSGGLGAYLNDVFYSPLFMMGAGVLGGRNVGEGISQGLSGAGQAQMQRLRMKSYEDEQANRERMRQMWGNLDAIGLNPQQTQALRVLGPDAGSKVLTGILAQQAEASGKTSLQPIYGVDQAGNPVVMQPRADGTVVRSKMPDGVQVSKAPIKMDAGTHFVLMDPITRQPIGTVPKDIIGKESAEEIGKARGKAQMDLPRIEDNASQALQTIQQIRNHPGKQWGTGPLGVLPRVPGTAQAGFVNLVEQAKGKVFLEAFNSLKGGGQITEAEGNKATQALARLDRAQSKEDFETALRDLEVVINDGAARARRAAGNARMRGEQPQVPAEVQQQAPAAPTAPQIAPGSRMVYDPATGTLQPAGGGQAVQPPAAAAPAQPVAPAQPPARSFVPNINLAAGADGSREKPLESAESAGPGQHFIGPNGRVMIKTMFGGIMEAP